MDLTNKIKEIASVDIFNDAKVEECFLGRPFYLDYDKAYLLIADAWKKRVGGVPQGAFLLAFYENEDDITEALLLRALKPTKLPSDNDVISSMIEYYKDNLTTYGKKNQLDDFTRYEFSFSGLECKILGTFYKDDEGNTRFGADVENFYSAHNYTVYKPQGKVLEYIVNFRDGKDIPGSEIDVRIGKIRYSSSTKFQEQSEEVRIYINPKDFLGKRTALFGMTRTGKSNTVKKIIQCTVEISDKSKYRLESNSFKGNENNLDPFDKNGFPKYPVGQIIFDIDGEYANANMQDEGTAIFEMYKDRVIRYSLLPKEGFNVMKVNFYNEVQEGFELIKNFLGREDVDYVNSFKAIDLTEPEDDSDHSAKVRYERKKAAYLCCLYRAGFKVPKSLNKIKFEGNDELNKLVKKDSTIIDPSEGITLEEACNWFSTIWDNYDNDFFKKYKEKKAMNGLMKI